MADCRGENGEIDSGKFSLRFWKEHLVFAIRSRRLAQINVQRALAALDHAIAMEAYRAAIVAHYEKHGEAIVPDSDETAQRLTATQRAEYDARKKLEAFPARKIELPPDL